MTAYTKNGRIILENAGIIIGQFFKEGWGDSCEYTFWPSVKKPNWTVKELKEAAEHLERMNQGILPDNIIIIIND